MRGNGLTAEAYTAVAAVDRMHAGDALLVLREAGIAAYVVLDEDGTTQVFADRDAVEQARQALRDLTADPAAGPTAGPTAGAPDGSADPGFGDHDIDDAWRQIVAGYDESAEEPPSGWTLPSRITTDAEPDPRPEPDPPPPPRARPRPTDDGDTDSLNTEATWDDEGHFVPPEPPPVMPPRDLVSRLAWSGLVGGPLILLAAVVFGITLPTEVMMVCSLGFVGGLVTLILRLKDRGDDGFGPDDGARL